MTDQRAGDSHADEKQGTSADEPDDATKTQDLTKAGREDFDPNAGAE